MELDPSPRSVLDLAFGCGCNGPGHCLLPMLDSSCWDIVTWQSVTVWVMGCLSPGNRALRLLTPVALVTDITMVLCGPWVVCNLQDVGDLGE